ncbi:hypothetical protein J0895_24225 [Phormidium pseudopriestleyi FRX01]|uniref:Uncharacterized protein n=1 Tax=Phormidium pseudopriestleyi FRX01 TaxID=1759528 RepID=A0ABS3FZH2_9CYAN|nr:hypothetical protein [Phormidium pseudopriestleyi]MBO0352133.1 hypothetical protein [Phormidium pseudopriestleyi FRX01]
MRLFAGGFLGVEIRRSPRISPFERSRSPSTVVNPVTAAHPVRMSSCCPGEDRPLF